MSKNTISAKPTGLRASGADLATPLADRRRERHSRAYLDMESHVFDLRNMSILLETITQEAIGNSRDRDGDSIKILLTEDQFSAIHFAVSHVGDMARELMKAWEIGFKVGPDA